MATHPAVPRTLDVNDHSSHPRAVPGSGSLQELHKAAFLSPQAPAKGTGMVSEPQLSVESSPATQHPALHSPDRLGWLD